MIHAAKRFRERYGFDLKVNDFDRAQREVSSGDSLFIKPYAKNAEVHSLQVKGIWTFVLVSDGEIKTFLPFADYSKFLIPMLTTG